MFPIISSTAADASETPRDCDSIMCSSDSMFDAISFTAPAVWFTDWFWPSICLRIESMFAIICVIDVAVSLTLAVMSSPTEPSVEFDDFRFAIID